MKNLWILLFILIFSFSCKNQNNYESSVQENSLLEYAEKTKMYETSDSIFIHSNQSKLSFAKSDLPLNSAMIVPTSAIAFMSELDLLDKITGVNQGDFIYNQEIRNRLQDGTIEEIGTFNEIFIEKIMVNKPDVFITTSSPMQAKHHQLMENQGIKILFMDEYEEINPLGKAEYVKIIGKLFGKVEEAENLFDEIVSNYHKIQSEIKEFNQEKPTIFANQIYGDVWYMPGGNSFQAKLFEDAGGNYLWSNNNSEITLNLSFESVYKKASQADIWMNVGDFPNKAALLASFPNYNWFKAFKNGNIYNWNKRKSATGANDYFETGTARPDWVLKDLAAIFHPELFPGHELFFYEKLE